MIRSKKRLAKWRQSQELKKKKTGNARVLLGISFLLFVVSLIIASWLWKKAKNSIWDGKSFIGVIYQSGADFKLLTILPEYRQYYDWIIPGNTLMTVPRGYGEYQLKNVYNLGQLDKKGGQLLSQTIQNGLAIPVSGWQIKEAANLSWWDKLRLKWVLIFNRKTTKIDLRQVALKALTLSDGTQVYQVNQNLLDETVNRFLFDETMIKEGISLAVINASGIEGEAKTVARLVANLGGDVRMIGNKQVQAQSEILVAKQNLKTSYTVKRLSQALKIDQIKVGIETDLRAEVAVVIARDYTQVY